MTLARLLPAALLFCSLPALGQDRQTVLGNSREAPVKNGETTATPSEPWRVIPNRPADLTADSADHIRVDQYRFNQDKLDLGTGDSKLEAKTRPPVLGLDGELVQELDGDTTCFSIRSYVVARDSKDSDSTHPAGYSTCRRASRYHLKTAEGQSVSSVSKER
jgi:hypothetical protein